MQYYCKYHCAGDCLTRATDGFDLFKINNPLRCEINQELTKDQIVKLLCSDYNSMKNTSYKDLSNNVSYC